MQHYSSTLKTPPPQWTSSRSYLSVTCDIFPCDAASIAVLRSMTIDFSAPCRKEFFNWIQEWRIWWMELQQHPLVDGKPFPDDICAVEAYIIPHNSKIWQVTSYQTSLIVRDKISVAAVQECLQIMGVVYANIGNM